MKYNVAFWLLLLCAIAVALTGGFRTEVQGIRVSVQWPTGLCLFAWLSFVQSERLRSRGSLSSASIFTRISALVEQYGSWLAVGLAVCTGMVGLGLGALVAAGADPYGYVSQSLLWLRGNPVQPNVPLALDASWPIAAWTFCPLGYKPSHIAGLVVPTYAVGLPLQMAGLIHLFGMTGAFLVVPVMGGVAVWAAYRVGLHVCGGRSRAFLCAVLVACSPVFLFQLMQPMSDVPATAWWLLSICAALDGAGAAALGAGLYSSLAILTRPNLALLALPTAAYVAFGRPGTHRSRLMRTLLYGVGLVPGVALVAASNAVFFGSPLVSGYGALRDIYHLGNAEKNLVLYGHWLYTTHSPLIYIGLGAALVPLMARRLETGRRSRLVRHGMLGGAFAVALLISYVFYIPFDHWTYLRFLLPAIPVLLILGVATVDTVAGLVPSHFRSAPLALVAIVLPLYYVSFARHGDAFALKHLFEDRYVAAASRVAERTPKTAIVLSLNQSGSLRLYAGRTTVRYDLIPAGDLDRVVRFFVHRGRPVYVALESTERVGFREKFGRAFPWEAQRTVAVDPLALVTLTGPLQATGPD